MAKKEKKITDYPLDRSTEHRMIVKVRKIIDRRMKERGVTPHALSKLVDVRPATTYAFLKGGSIRLETLLAVLEALEMELEIRPKE